MLLENFDFSVCIAHAVQCSSFNALAGWHSDEPMLVGAHHHVLIYRHFKIHLGRYAFDIV